MSKNALVLDDHFGDDGHVSAGKILRDVDQKRFDILEKKRLVREATPEEVKAGDQIAFEKDNTADLQPAGDASDEGGDKAKEEPKNKKAPEPKNKEA